jgi:NAD(P) transhydrogenase subunit alpha
MTEFNETLSQRSAELAHNAQELAAKAAALATQAGDALAGAGTPGDDFLIQGLTVFVLACFVGYYVVWRVTPALHSPLMAVTNAISSVIIVGALMAVGTAAMPISQWLGFLAVVLASVNIFGGFLVTRRMLAMYKKKEPQKHK